MTISDKKCLVAFYSRKGNNYVNGSIVNLPVGNTEVITKKIQGLVGGDLFEINTVKPYPADYTETTVIARVLPGLAIRGGSVAGSRQLIQSWLEKQR